MFPCIFCGCVRKRDPFCPFFNPYRFCLSQSSRDQSLIAYGGTSIHTSTCSLPSLILNLTGFTEIQPSTSTTKLRCSVDPASSLLDTDIIPPGRHHHHTRRQSVTTHKISCDHTQQQYPRVSAAERCTREVGVVSASSTHTGGAGGVFSIFRFSLCRHT